MNHTDRIPTPRRSPRAHLNKCTTTGKVRYRDDREAEDALHRLVNSARLADELGGGHTIRVKRMYACTSCRGWHLTSQEVWILGADVLAPSSARAS